MEFDVSTNVPKYGLKLKLNHIYPEKKKQDIETPLKQMIQLTPLILRYVQYYVNAKRTGRKPFIDHLKLLNGLQIYGCPIGGIGAGTIGRGYKGEFCRFQLRPGIYDYRIIHENQFIVSIRNENDTNIFQSVLSAYEKPKQSPNGWEWNIDGSKCEYTALYPRAWTEYDLSEYGVKLICRQVSPIIPNNYKDSSLPCAVFVWQIINVCTEPRSVSIAFTWSKDNHIKNKDLCNFASFNGDNSFGISLSQHIGGMPCSFTLAKSKLPSDEDNQGVCAFNSNVDCKKIWDDIFIKGNFMLHELENSEKQKYNAIGICGELKLKPGCTSSLEFSLIWDMPSVLFQNKTQVYKRFYTRFFGSEGVSGPTIASYALQTYKKWEHDIFEWQKPIMDDNSYPDWYKGALMNELYFISDGGTIWFDVSDKYPNNDPRGLYGLFGYLEGHEYRMYNTYDVHFYASFALTMLWPNLQVSMQYTFRDSIPYEMETLRGLLYHSGLVKRKVANSVPHDMGDPDEEPFIIMNAYNVHDVSEWRDLNPKFILQVFRDFNFLQESSKRQADNASDNDPTENSMRKVYNAFSYLQDMYPICKTLINIMKTWDKDNDGLIENSGFPDQTFDAWVMTGPSAYCGGLWLAALCVMFNMAKILGKDEDAIEYEDLLEKGRKAFEAKLWTGDYYKFDSNPHNKQIIMADQLCAQWYLRSCGFHYEVFPKENVSRALDTIYENNVKGFYNGKLGACNGYVMARGNKPGHIDNTSIPSGESWTGVTYGLAALMVHEGKLEQAFDMAGSMYETINQQFGMSFETPEAFNDSGNYRSIGYMRPLSIWAMQHALTATDSGLKSTRL